MWTIVEMLLCAVETVIIIDFMIRYLDLKSERSVSGKLFVWGMIVMTFEMSGILGILPERLVLAIEVLVSSGYIVTCYKGKTWKKILVISITFSVLHMADLMFSKLFSFVWGNETGKLFAETGTFQLWMSGYIAFFLFILTRLILCQKMGNPYRFHPDRRVFLVCIFVCTTCIYILLQNSIVSQYNESKSIFYTFVMCVIIIAGITIYDWIIYTTEKKYQKMELQLLKLQLEQQKKAVIQVYEEYQEILKIRHDTKNYVSNALGLIEAGYIQDAIEYMKKFQDMKLGRYQKIVDTDSQVLNAVVNSKFSYAYEKNIHTEYCIQGRMKSVEEFDLSILLSNLLDNAIEACERNKNPSEISLKILEREGYLNIRISNSIEQSAYDENGRLRTKKKDKSSHGYGMKSVCDIVKKHEGMIDMEEKDNQFIVDILLKKETDAS